jgi:23S rRNA (adenine2503-C2)-methyltransferase
METLLGQTETELCAYLQTLGEAAFRGKQLYQSIYQRRMLDLAQMTNLSKPLRDKLATQIPATQTNIANIFTSTDGTRRYLLELGDGQQVESVFMPEERRDTICISCQVGCAVGCKFCMTAQLGIKRNMTAGEIVSQVIIVLNDVYGAGHEPPHGTNLVFMGMGESFLNYDEVMQAIRLLCDAKGLNIAPRRITVSTSGIIPKIRQFADEPVRPRLAISLSGTTDEQRTSLIPLNKRYGLAELMAALRDYPLGERERLTFEYVMLDGVNDSDEDARRLVRLIHKNHLRAKVNLIPHNPAPELPFQSSSPARIASFQQTLNAHGVDAYLRRPRGQDIAAACGQLAARPEASPVAVTVA